MSETTSNRFSEWDTATIRQWMYVIGERSDRVIHRAMEDDDWSDYEDDERMYSDLSAELERRGEKYR